MGRFTVTYDLNNKNECQMVEDYVFYRYYTKSIYFDWKQYKKDIEERNEKGKLIRKHIKANCNSIHLKQALEIHRRIWSECSNYCKDYDELSDDNIFDVLIDDVFFYSGNWFCLRCLKFSLIEYLKDN
jgi:hypothetical protein